MAKSKVVNYTKAQATELVAAYGVADSDESRANVVAEYAEKFGKTKASVRQKLVSEGVYQAAERLTKNGSKVEKKEDILNDIAKLIGCPSTQLSGVERGTKVALQTIRTAMVTFAKAANAKPDSA